jgi:Flp pilus assembly protein TadD
MTEPTFKALVLEGKRLIKENDLNGAARVFKKAYGLDKNDPECMSYHGMCSAVRYGEIKFGLELCTMAIKKECFKPEYYANLARVYIAAGNKKGAITAITKGLKYEKGDELLHHMLVDLGVRKKPVIGFFKRSNPLNKALGILMRRTLPGIFKTKGPKK